MAPPVVLLDANALMMPFQFPIDLEGELVRLFGQVTAKVPSSVLRELERLAPANATAKAARRFAARFPVLEVDGEGDDALLALARAEGAAVLTNDKALRRRVREAGLPVVFLRERSRLEAVGRPPG